MIKKSFIAMSLTLFFATGVLTACANSKESINDSNTIEITNVSYDPTREFYESYNNEFNTYWKEKTGQEVIVTQSHGGSGKQARSVVEGNEADVVTLALAHDITLIEEAGLINEGWINEFKENSAPYTSTIVFLVRKGNPENIKDWNDLVRDGVEVITPNPKSSGGARWNFLSAWAYADNLYNSDENKIMQFVSKLYKNVIVLDSGARGATTTFVENGQGDVLIGWENEAYLSVKEHPEEFEIISPSISVLAEPSVAVVDEVAEKNGNTEVANEYIEYLYSDKAQRLAGENYYRPSNKTILKEFENVFDLNIIMKKIEDFGGWSKANKDFFEDKAIFDQIYSQ